MTNYAHSKPYEAFVCNCEENGIIQVIQTGSRVLQGGGIANAGPRDMLAPPGS